jgi:hypothetical protein
MHTKVWKLLSIMMTIFMSSCWIVNPLSATNTIHGIVWNDKNANGIIDGESGIEGITVVLYTCFGQFITAQKSFANGTYSFSSVVPGQYKVYFKISDADKPYIVSPLSTNTDNDALADGYTACFNMGEPDVTLNAGLTVLPFVRGIVWDDTDGDGLRTSDEPGLANVRVQLTDAINLSVVDTTHTSSTGKYLFKDVPPGAYYVEFFPEEPFEKTIENPSNPAFNSDLTNAKGRVFKTADFELNTSLYEYYFDAGFYTCAKICGTAYYDVNFSDTLDVGENGINGLVINLWQITPDGIINVDRVKSGKNLKTASEDGYFEFCVTPGKYFIEISIPDGTDLIAGLPYVGSNAYISNQIDHSNGLNTTKTFTLESGGELCDLNNGFYCSGSLETLVWKDENLNGVREKGEPMLENILVRLYDLSGNLHFQQFTDKSGKCLFEDLHQGIYYLKYMLTPNSEIAAPHASVDTLDSDIDHSNGTFSTPAVQILLCNHIRHIDAGVLPAIALPVVWKSAVVTRQGDKNAVIWEVGSESNVHFYTVYRKVAGTMFWDELTTVKAKNSISGWQYSWMDESFPNTDLYYMISATDFDGHISVSNIMHINLPDDNIKINVYPNPSSDDLNISWSGLSSVVEYFVKLVDVAGSKIMDVKLNAKESFHHINTKHFQSGLYKFIFYDMYGNVLVNKPIVLVK